METGLRPSAVSVIVSRTRNKAMTLTKKKSLLWHFYPICLLVLFLGLAFSGLYALRTMKQTLLDDMEGELLVKARILEPILLSLLQKKDFHGMNRLCREAGAVSGVRFTLVLPSGEVLADSEADPSGMENHGNRVEIVRALSGETFACTRYSETLGKSLMYLAIPIEDSGSPKGILRASFSVSAIEDTVSRAGNRILLFSIFLFILAGVLFFRIFHSLVRPVHSLEEGARSFARGELKSKISSSSIREMAVLAEAMNDMAAQLDLRIQSEVRGKNELEALLASMREGVIALDADRRILRINPAASDMFGVVPEKVLSRDLAEGFRNRDFLNFVDRALLEKKPMDADIFFPLHGERIVEVHASPMGDGEKVIGAVLVLHEVTRIRKLETMRRDFVANVSHEIRTPLTSVLGFVETLMEEREMEPEERKRFLSIINRNVKRLVALVADLLQISALEDEGNRKIAMTSQEIGPVLLSAINTCHSLSMEKKIRITADFDGSLAFPMDAALMEQAVLNLLENALKYSPEESSVQVRAEERENDFRILVADQGIGIAKEHLPRLAERFYRVDRARSRKLGGTGLGLAIVKHIMSLHRGSLEVESSPNEGSAFFLVFPKM